MKMSVFECIFDVCTVKSEQYWLHNNIQTVYCASKVRDYTWGKGFHQLFSSFDHVGYGFKVEK